MDSYGWAKTGGDDSDLIMINQNALSLSNAIKLAEADFKHELINYNEHAIDKWCFANAGLKVDDKGLALIVKLEAGKRIDGAVCLAILYETFRRVRTEYKQIIGDVK
jgi:phage terminase large subunit-like protein